MVRGQSRIVGDLEQTFYACHEAIQGTCLRLFISQLFPLTFEVFRFVS
jgi:hypothetical protein